MQAAINVLLKDIKQRITKMEDVIKDHTSPGKSNFSIFTFEYIKGH